jgi:hypothetical protein
MIGNGDDRPEKAAGKARSAAASPKPGAPGEAFRERFFSGPHPVWNPVLATAGGDLSAAPP